MALRRALIFQVLKTVLFTCLFISAVLAVAEIWFRCQPEKPGAISSELIKARLWRLWLNKENTDPLLPPFKVFSNTDIDNIERLRFIAKETGLPKNARLTSYDFLRPEEMKEETTYTATINDLGFRDPPRTAEKPENTYRIIVLGSYQAFGHGVNDEDAYPRRLERILNDSEKHSGVFEVWNGGRHTGTAIMGLARLRTEVLAYRPDLIVWDFGFVDYEILGDNLLLQVLQLPDSWFYRPLGWFFSLSRDVLLQKSKLFSQIQNYWIGQSKKKNVENFSHVTKKMLSIAKENDIPVILLRHTMVLFIEPQVYRDLAGSYEKAYFVDGMDIFGKYPPSPDLIKKFRSGPNWLTEYAPDRDYFWPYSEYFKSLPQYNEAGYEAIARYLADTIEGMPNIDRLKSADVDRGQYERASGNKQNEPGSRQ